ncbi:HD domain protein, partial [Gregarina niphandrodes]
MAEIHLRRNRTNACNSVNEHMTPASDLQRALSQGNRGDLYDRLSTFGVTTFARLEGALASPYELVHFSPNTVSYLRDLMQTRQRVCKRFRSVADPVYDTITFANDIWEAVIDTKPFQRLRGLKQVGVASYVYPSAVHTRFEHCLGVGHLAGEWFSKLHNSCYPRQSANAFEWESVKTALQIAGLCHDLGHGPFSHAFEVFVHNYYPAWHHEDMSVALVEYLCDTGPLGPLVDDLGGAVSRKDICNMILGNLPGETQTVEAQTVEAQTPDATANLVQPAQLPWADTSFGPGMGYHAARSSEGVVRTYADSLLNSSSAGAVGQPEAMVSMNESVLSPSLGTPARSPATMSCTNYYKIDDDKFRRGAFSLIHNADTGFDVDRMDYLRRDVTIAPGLPRVNIGRLMNNSTISQEGKIVFDLKCQSDVFAFYRTRFDMFNNVYLHKNCIAIELMLVDVLKVMEPVYKLSDAIFNVEDFLNLSDGVLLEVKNTCIRTRVCCAQSHLFQQRTRCFTISPPP